MWRGGGHHDRQIADREVSGRRNALRVVYDAIGEYERGLARQLLDGLSLLNQIKVWGITDAKRADQRLPTLSVTHAEMTATQLAEELGRRGIFVWHGNYYALSLTEALGLEPEGMVRIGLVHYNTSDEVDRLIDVLSGLG